MFKSRESVLALDLGSSCLKAVELEAGSGGPVLKRIAALEMPAPLDGDREARPDHRARLLTSLGDLLRGMGVQPKKVRRLVSSLPGTQVSIKQIRCPVLPDAEIRSALVFEARKHLPVEGEVLMDFQILARRPEDLDILLVVTTKQAVVNHLALLEACGLKGGLVEAPSLALWNAWLDLGGRNGKGTVPAGASAQAAAAAPAVSAISADGAARPAPAGFLNIGAASSSLSFYQEGGLFLTREIPIAGDRFTEDEREKNGWDFPKAEKAKVARGLFGQGSADGAADPGAGGGSGKAVAGQAPAAVLELEGENTGQHPSLQNLAREIQRSIRFYLKESGQARIGSLALAGGSAASAGLEEWLGRELGVPVAGFDPLARLENRAEAMPANRRQFAQAVGMALRGAHAFFPN